MPSSILCLLPVFAPLPVLLPHASPPFSAGRPYLFCTAWLPSPPRPPTTCRSGRRSRLCPVPLHLLLEAFFPARSPPVSWTPFLGTRWHSDDFVHSATTPSFSIRWSSFGDLALEGSTVFVPRGLTISTVLCDLPLCAGVPPAYFAACPFYLRQLLASLLN